MEHKNANPAAGDGGVLEKSSLELKVPEITAKSRTAQDCRRRPRRMATPAERRQAREVAAYVQARGLDEEPLLIALALVAGRFPDIALDTALAGFVFRSVLVGTQEGCE